MLCDSQMCKISWTKTNLTLTWLGFCQNPNLTTTQPQPNLNIFLTQKFFWPKNIFDPKIFFTKIFFTKIFFEPKIIFFTKIFSTQIFFDYFSSKLVWPQNNLMGFDKFEINLVIIF